MKHFFIFAVSAIFALVFFYASSSAAGTAVLKITNPNYRAGTIEIEGTDKSCSYSTFSGVSECEFPFPENQQNIILVGKFSTLPFRWTGCDRFTRDYKCVIDKLNTRKEVTVQLDESLRSSQSGDQLPVIMVPAQNQKLQVYAGDGFVQQISAQDPEKQELTFALRKGPDGFSIDPKSGTAAWQVPLTFAGKEASVEFFVSDRPSGNTA
ncbi:MAG: hypothetical protein HYV78_00710 [Candidatus Wildermuthbacteria bacterium]|nr:hypothetical protein [Candidatus Wildermuthbacteria bacterium]